MHGKQATSQGTGNKGRKAKTPPVWENKSLGVRQENPHHLSSVEVVLEEHRDAGGLDGHAPVLLVLAGVGEAHPSSCVLGGGDAGLGREIIREGGLAVAHVRDYGHVPDVVLVVHDLTELVRREINLWGSIVTDIKQRTVAGEAGPK